MYENAKIIPNKILRYPFGYGLWIFLVSYIHVSVSEITSLKYERLTPSSFENTVINVMYFGR